MVGEIWNQTVMVSDTIAVETLVKNMVYHQMLEVLINAPRQQKNE